MSKKISLADIANALGVSKTLVSLVINGKGNEHGISKETQKRVLEKIDELNYRPNVLARGFRTGKTNTIGLIVSDISNRFYSRIARRVEDYAWEHGYTVIICSTDENVEKELQQVKMLRERKVDGLIISSSQEKYEDLSRLLNDVPHVLIDRTFNGINSAQVYADNYQGSKLAANHLVSQGIKNVAILSITPEYISTIRERTQAFVSTLAKSNIAVPAEWNIHIPFKNMESAVEERLQMLKETKNLPEAIFALNNNLTSHCLLALRKLSLSIPDDIALIGFDDMLYFSFTQPSVSAISQPIEQIGEKAFDLLLRQINNEEITIEERSVKLPVELIIRDSSTKTS
ncbi:LacI family DNA-binding transcriptional regulator [Perlabentimonas gracilis]|uniref:LacI family DNA-binding transcriptional regulator n=1 Tax=Perlabentimonas gracilis TaxID=2715279 RepID=UPI00140D9BA9|nr:LacI family DNA-binding transcriptional regulator [Perlabentimonas gracilis]NHB68700.1 LacI family transcriptional regulator [Perlabentimonas gracilis]